MVEKHDLTTKLIDSFKELISQGVLVPGSRLPAERDLAQQFGVSRPSLRHALKVLESMGVLSQKVGSGTYLNTSAEEILRPSLEFVLLLDEISHSEVLDTRYILEPEMAARAAENATAEHLRAIEETLAPTRTAIEDGIQADIAFHRAIFNASANRLCVRLFSALHLAMISTMRMTSVKTDWKLTLSFHRPIYDAIYRRDAEEARHRMAAHLENSKRLLHTVTGGVRRPASVTSITPIAR
jgi:GntR family transcriptional regulator, transcriptional repressor for pyruvate dehydrogenase complex